jgi:hypothetical protein
MPQAAVNCGAVAMSHLGVPLADLLPALNALPRADKLRVMQMLVAELARDEGLAQVPPGEDNPIWAPRDAFDGAAVLLKALDAEKAGP